MLYQGLLRSTTRQPAVTNPVMQDARAHNESTNTCSCLNQTVALASLIPSTHSVTFPNIASLGRSLDETWAGIEKCTSCGNRRQIAESISQSVLKLTMFCEAACVTYKLLNNSNQLQLQPFSSGAGSQQQQLPVIDGHGYSSYQQQQQQQQPFYAFATQTPTLTPTDDPTIQAQIPAVVCEKRPMRLQSYLLDDEEAELLALQIVGAIAEKLSSITFTLQAWEFEFENERDAFGRGSAGPVSRVSVEGIQARVGVLRRNLRSEGNRQSRISDDVGIL